MMEQHDSGRSILLLLLPLQKMESKAIMCKWFRLGSIHPSIHQNSLNLAPKCCETALEARGGRGMM
jgi:hypothetical protein